MAAIDTEVEGNSTPQRDKRLSWLGKILTWCATALTLLAALGSFVGWAVVFGALARVNVFPSMLIEGPADALMLSWVGVLQIAGNVMSFDVWPMIKTKFEQQWPVFLWLQLVVPVSLLLFRWWPQVWDSAAGRWLACRWTSLKRLRARRTWSVQDVRKALSARWIAAITLGIAALQALFFGLLPIVVTGLIAVLIAVTVFIPGILATVGTQYVKKYVIDPIYCAVPAEVALPPSPSSGTQGPAALCVRVSPLKPGEKSAYCGRLVLATSKYVVLYRPEKRGFRVPIADMVVETVGNDVIADCRAPSGREEPRAG